MTPYELYSYYLSNYQAPQSFQDGITSIQPISPVSSFQLSNDGIASLADPTTGTVGTGTISLSDIGKALGFAMNPVGYGISMGINRGVQALTGQTVAQNLKSIVDSIASNFGGGNPADAVGTAADPSTMASEDPSAIGSQSGGGSNSDGAAAASAAGANDDASTGGPF